MEAIKNYMDIEKTEELKKCQYCGKPYNWFEKTILNGAKHLKFQVPACDCLEKLEKEKEENEKKALKQERLNKRFDNSMITPFFKEKTFEFMLLPENLAIYKNESDIIKCQEYAANFKSKVSPGIQMIGNVGRAKTTLLAAICNELISNNFCCLFTTLSALLDKFSSYSYNNSGDIVPLLNWITSFDFVVLDDIGRETYTEKRKETAFRIIDALLNYKVVTAFSANPDMIDKLKQIPECGAMLDRLRDVCGLVFLFHGESLRGLKCK
jgi:DNA replication protein DnaC